MTTSEVDAFTLSVDSPAAGAARLRLAGHLDEAAARELLHTAADLVRGGCARLVVDLDGLTGHDEQARYGLVGCTRLGRFLHEGVAVVAGGAAGSELADAAEVAIDVAPDRAPGSGRFARPRAAAPDTLATCHAC